MQDFQKTVGKRPEDATKNDIRRYLVAVGDRSSAGNAENKFRSLRASELGGLRREGVDLANGSIIVRGKGAKERRLPLGFRAAKALARHMAKSPGTDLVFTTEKKETFTHCSLRNLLERLSARAGLRRFGPHLLRHTFAVTFVSAGGSPFHLQRLLGHTTLEMTRRYCNLADGDLKDAHGKYGPGDRL